MNWMMITIIIVKKVVKNHKSDRWQTTWSKGTPKVSHVPRKKTSELQQVMKFIAIINQSKRCKNAISMDVSAYPCSISFTFSIWIYKIIKIVAKTSTVLQCFLLVQWKFRLDDPKWNATIYFLYKYFVHQKFSFSFSTYKYIILYISCFHLCFFSISFSVYNMATAKAPLIISTTKIFILIIFSTHRNFMCCSCAPDIWHCTRYIYSFVLFFHFIIYFDMISFWRGLARDGFIGGWFSAFIPMQHLIFSLLLSFSVRVAISALKSLNESYQSCSSIYLRWWQVLHRYI